MAPQQKDRTPPPPSPHDPLPQAMGKPALRAMHGAGITTLAQAAKWPAEELAKLHGVGPKALRVLRESLTALLDGGGPHSR